MSTWRAIGRLAVEIMTCPYCQSPPRHRCVTRKSGALLPIGRSHDGRTRPLWDLWRDGYGEGLADSASMVESLYLAHRPFEQIVEIMKRNAA